MPKFSMRQTTRPDRWWESKKYKLPAEKCVLMASGGIDSTVMMYELAKKGLISEVITVNSGQASFKRQIQLVRHHAKVNGLKSTVLKVPLPKEAIRDEINKPGFVPRKIENHLKYVEKIIETEAAETYLDKDFAWIEGRNILWFTHAAIHTIFQGKERIFTAFQFDTPRWKALEKGVGQACDTSPLFVEHMNDLFFDVMLRYVDIVAPYLELKMDKSEIVDLGRSLGIDFAKNMTYSCEFYPPCGNCYQCETVNRVRAQFQK